MDRARVWATCVVVVVATGCTAITGADDLVADRPASDTSSTTPERNDSASNPTKSEEKESGSTTPPASSGGDGGPLPTLDGVACGLGASCGGNKPKCCARGNSNECVAADTDCNDGYVFACSDQESCAQGTVCCFITSEGKPKGECRAAKDCVLPSVIMCDSDEECPSKKCTGEIAGLDYEVCAPY